ncbi:MAG: helix-turn-helix domain-containing protein [Patescibacteria group bacterium]|jgi:hypothetical protein
MSFVHKHLAEGTGFGHDLCELRELRGLSLDDLGAITKIHSSVILALEEERLGDLVDPTYAERHVRSLVTALEGRPGYFIKKYRELVEARGMNNVTTIKRDRPPRARDFFVLAHAMAFAGFLFVVALTAGYFVWQGRLLQNAPPLVVMTPMDGAILDIPRVDVRGTTDPSAVVTVNGRPAVVDREGGFFISFDIPRGSMTLTIEARRRFGSSVSEVRRITYERPTIPQQ